jgi:flagellar basal body-associated protein FliL
MKTNKGHSRLWLVIIAGLVIVSAILIFTWLFLRKQESGKTIAFTHVNLIPMTSETVMQII